MGMDEKTCVAESSPTQVEQAQTALKQPRRYAVYLMNDDFTPMQFVVEILTRFFNYSREAATRLMWQIHTEGRAICATYTKDIAETKVSQVNGYARQQDYPLLCAMEVAKQDLNGS